MIVIILAGLIILLMILYRMNCYYIPFDEYMEIYKDKAQEIAEKREKHKRGRRIRWMAWKKR